MVLTAAAVMLGVHVGVLAGVRPEPVEQMAALIDTHRAGGEPVGEYDVFVRNLVFYARFPQTPVVDANVAEFLAEPGRLLVVRERDLGKAQQASALPLRELGRVRYFNAANLRLRTFLRAEPTDEVETVLLMTNRPDGRSSGEPHVALEDQQDENDVEDRDHRQEEQLAADPRQPHPGR
jgi:hypothetical protein